MKERSGLIALAMKYNKIVLLLIGILVICGVFALYKIPKQEFPIFTIRQGVVVAAYPGATSGEVEEQVAKPLEKFLFTYKEVKKSKTYSKSRDGMVYVFVELNDEVNNKDEVWSKIKHGLSNFKAQLPSGVLALVANDDFGDTSALLIALESNTKTYRQLQDYLESLEERLRTIESVSNLRRYGLQNEQLSVYVDKEKIANYGINIYTLYQTLLSKGLVGPSGKIDNDGMVVPIHITRPFTSERDLEEQIVYSDPQGNNIRLKDVARLVREYPKASSYTINNGNKCLILSSEMREGYNIVQYGKDVNEVVNAFEGTLPDDVKIFRIADQPEVVGASITTFLKELGIAILAVILVTMVLLPIRVAGVAASTIPITIFISLALMFAFGIELNTVTLAALVVVLGMIVDNSIVIVDSYLEKLDEGIPRWDAAIESAKEYFKAILSATLAIGITFFPFLVTFTGQLFDFVQAFPWTILITLGISLAVAVFFVPYFQYVFVTKGLHKAEKEDGRKKSILDHVQSFYDKTLLTVFRYPMASISLGILTVVIGLFMFVKLPLKLMPIAERNQFAVEIYLPQGNSLKQTTEVAGEMERILRQDQRVTSLTAFMGTGSPRFHTTYAPKIGGPNFAQFIVNTVSSEATVEMLDEYATTYSKYFPNAFVKFKQMDYQAGVDADVEVRLSGDHIADLKLLSDIIGKEAKTWEEPVRVYTNYEEILPDVTVALNPVESNRLGISEGILGIGLASRFGGLPITTVWEGDYQLPVVLKSKWDNRQDPLLGDVENEYVSGLYSPAVPLRQVATVTTGWNEGQIVRRNGVRTLSVYIDLKRGYKIDPVQRRTEELMDRLAEEISDRNITVAYGGIKENTSETLPKIVGGLLISVGIIFFILVFHFKKISLASLVFASTAFSFFGAALGLWLMDMDFSMTSVLGLVSLIGIIVRNGIIMYDYIEILRTNHHLPVREACLKAGERRMRPILLTSMAASMGVIPMIISKSPLWAPMGTVIFFGTLISMIFILTMLPLIYWLTYRKQDNERPGHSLT